MSSGGPPLIAPKVHECVRRFNALRGLLPEADRIVRPALIDQLGRLKIWAGNIGAFQELPLLSSLDYRLREAPKIVNQVIELLNDLNETLQEVSSIISGERPNRVNAIRDGGIDDLTSGNDDNDENEDDASVLSDQSQPSSELQELLESSSDTITSLFKISVLIKSATTRDRYAKAAKAQGEPFDARFDISHVGHKFPLVHQTDWLEKRLGKAITQRRQYLRYCRQHRDRLDNQHKATDVTENAADRQPMPVRKPVEESSQVTKSQIQSLNPPSTFAITTASTLVVNNFESLDEFPEEVQSQTSYATSLNEDESTDMLRVPPLPDEAVHGLPFECPYCWAPQLIKTRRAWKKHTFLDLKPYVCTFEECDLKMFADRSTWFSHELQVHRIEWCCPFCSHSPLQSLESFKDHLQNRHAQKFIEEQLPALGATCQQSVDKISPQACPFCDEWFVKLRDTNPDLAGETLVVTPAQFQHHVGSHMEQLALFALPKDHGDAVESTGVAGGADNRSDSELGSKASYECHNNPPLHIAAYEGLEAEVFQLLKDGAKVNAPGHTWGNVLQAAVVGGHVSIVQLLLDYGAEVTLYGGPYGQYSLYTAMQAGKEEMMRMLQEAREKTELKPDEAFKSMYYDHEGREKQYDIEIKENRDISLDLETRYRIALRYPRAEYTCPMCGEEFGDANQLWPQHAAFHVGLVTAISRDSHNVFQKDFIVTAERLSQKSKIRQREADAREDQRRLQIAEEKRRAEAREERRRSTAIEEKASMQRDDKLKAFKEEQAQTGVMMDEGVKQEKKRDEQTLVTLKEQAQLEKKIIKEKMKLLDEIEGSAPSPSFDLRSFGHGSPEGYQYQYSDCTGKRKALLIGINSGGHMITLAHLMEDYGFELDNMLILSDKAKDDTHLPTKENILKGMAWLVGGARTNDCLVFHYAGPTHRITNPDKEDGSPFIHAFHPVDFDKAGLITSDDMHRVMIQPLRQGVRLTAFFDDFCDISPLKTPYIYSAEAVLEEADFSAKATRTVLARYSSNARTILRSMTSSSSSKQSSLPDYGLENLIKATKTSPADVIVMYSCRDTADQEDLLFWTAALAFFHEHRRNRRESYAQILSRMEALLPTHSTIRCRLSCSHPLDMQARFIM